MVVEFAPDVVQMILISVFGFYVVDNCHHVKFRIFTSKVRGKFVEFELAVHVISAF